MNRYRWGLAVFFLLLLLFACDPADLPPGERVDLRGNSTEGYPYDDYRLRVIRNQGGRNTCQTFAVIAALEAAYKREMGLDLDLSEEFLNFMGKNFFLRYNLFGTDYGPDVAENLIATMGGGNGYGWVHQLAAGFAVPREHFMYYRDGYSLSTYCPDGDDCRFGTDDYNTYISSQRNVNSFNLNPDNLPYRALSADEYFSIKSFGVIANGTDPAQIEQVLRDGYEVVWDFSVAGYTGEDDGDYIWRPEQTTVETTVQRGVGIDNIDDLPIRPTSIEWIKQGETSYTEGVHWELDGNQIRWIGGGSVPFPGSEYSVRFEHDNRRGDHVMLIVGFDKTDPENPYFIVKNSWGRDQTADEDGDGVRDGWTFISYDYIRYGYRATYITEVNPPRPWPELAFVGRWNASLDGHHGILDIFHLPGVFQEMLDREGVDVEDHRIGVYYTESGAALRVNGSIEGNVLNLYIDPDNPIMAVNRLRGNSFTFFLYREEPNTMSGYYFDGGQQFGAYAQRCVGNWVACGTDWLESRYDNPRPLTPESWLGRWGLDFDGITGEVTITGIDTSAATSDGLVKLEASMHSTRLHRPSTPLPVWVDPDEPDVLKIELENPIVGDTRNVYFRLLGSEAGVAAGSTNRLFGGDNDFGGYIRRSSAMLIANITSPRLEYGGVYPREATYLFGVQVFHDPAVECCTYRWTSEGVELSTEQMFSIWGYDFPEPSVNWVYVTVTDSAGNTAIDSIGIQFPENTPPTVEIESPFDGARFRSDEWILLDATTFDPDYFPDFEVPEDRIYWYIDDSTRSYARGPRASLTGLTVGKHTIRVEVYDTESIATDEVVIYILDPSEEMPDPTVTPTTAPGENHSPTPMILHPADGETFQANAYDSGKNQWYYAMTLNGTAFDEDEGTLSGSSLSWSISIDGGDWQFLGTGASLPVNFYAPACYGHEFKIRLTATDSNGASKSTRISIIINLFC